MYYDEDPTTTEQLTVVQINQLKDAWQRANAELVKYKDIAYNLQQKVENLTSAINDSYNQLELETAKSQISQQCCANPNKPVLLVKEIAKTLPKMNYHSLVATAFLKTGESWIALSSSSVSQETINFKSRLFDEMLRFRSRAKASRVLVESLPNILPLPVINYIHSGTVPATESAFDVFHDESKGHGARPRRGERSALSTENLYHESIVVRLVNHPDDANTETEEEMTLSERIVWLITVAPQHNSNPAVDIFTEEIPLRRLAVDHFGAHSSLLHSSNDYFTDKASAGEVCAIARDFWFPLLEHTAEVVMTALLHHFEARRVQTQLLQSDAVTEFTQLLNHSAGSAAELILEEAGATSYASSALLETMSQRSEEDDALQSQTLQDDAYWDRVWQSVPSSLEGFLVQHVEALSTQPPTADGSMEGAAHRVQRTCRCEVYLTSSTLVNEINNAHSMNHAEATDYSHNTGVIAELPVINSTRQVTSLKVRDTDSSDGQADAVNTVLRAALLKNTAAVQSFSEVSFHERAHTYATERTAGGSKGHRSFSGSANSGPRSASSSSGANITSAEHGPHVEFHTVVAVPLLRTEQQDLLGERLTSAEEAEIGALKGCILVHVTSVLLETPQAALDGSARHTALTRAHPMYASTFTANSTSTHSAYMEHIAGSYNLLEAGRQPLVLAVVDVVEVLGSMLLNFLHAHNNRPLNLLSMSATQGVSNGPGAISLDTGSVRDSESGAHNALIASAGATSYASASRWNTCLTDGLFSLLMPSIDSGSSSGGAASLESLAYHEETKTTHFAPLNQNALQQRSRAGADPSHAALMYHLCTLFHSDWALIFTSDGVHGANLSRESNLSTERTARFSSVQAEPDAGHGSVKVINNLGASLVMSAHQLPASCRNAIVHCLHHGNTHNSNLKHTSGNGLRARSATAAHEFIKEVSGLKNVPMSELLALLEMEPRLKQNIQQLCDSPSAALLHHTVAISLDSRGSVSLGADTQTKRKAQSGGQLEHSVPAASNLVILTGRFFRGPYHAPLLATPSVSQLGLLFQTALARRELILVQEAVGVLLAERSQSQQEMSLTEALEKELSLLQQRTLSHTASTIASLVAFRKGVLGVLIDFFAEMHKLHFANYTSPGSTGANADSGVTSALEVIGIELVVDESTSFDQGRYRKWALSASSADWVRVADDGIEPVTLGSSIPSTTRKRVIHAPPVQTLHSQSTTTNFAPAAMNLTAEVRVDALSGVYEEKGDDVLHVCPKARPSSRGAETTHSAGQDANLIGMSASILIHYEFPVAGTARSGRNSPQKESSCAGNSTGKFFSSLQSAPSWMRILKSFIGAHSQALFQPLYPVFTPLRMQGHAYHSASIDEEQPWEDGALQAQASNLAITALSSTIVQDSSRLLSSPVKSSNQDGHSGNDLLSLAHQQHPHYRYLHQRRLLRQLTVVPPFSAFMLIPIRELTTSEISVFDDDSSSENSDISVEADVEDVRYVHLLPPVVHHTSVGHGQIPSADHRRKSSNPFAQSVLPMKLNNSLRDALRSVRHEQGTRAGPHNARSEQDSTQLRTSRLTVLTEGAGSVLHSYLSDLHEKQQRRRAHHPGSPEYDLYGYVDVATHAAGEKTSRSVHQEISLVDPHSLVLLYTPLLHGTRKSESLNGLADLDEADEGVLSGDVGAELDHYYLIVCRQDRMVVPSSLVRLQSCLDELFLPSRVLAASQPWFECMTGIEQLVKAATMGSKVEFKPEESEEPNVLAFPNVGSNEPFSATKQGRNGPTRVPQELGVSFSAPIISVEGQCQRILIETISILKRVVGERCLGAVGYQLRIGQNELPDLLASTQESGGVEGYGSASSDMYRAGKEIELVRCCSDSGVVSSRSGKMMNMLQGPSKLQCPATSDLIVGRFVHPHARDHRAAVSAAIGALGQGHSPERRHAHALREDSAQAPRAVSIHYVEMSSLEHIKQLQHSATSESVLNSSNAAAARADAEQHTGPAAHTRKASNVAAVQELISTAHAFNHADVRVIQLLITSSPTDMPGFHSRREVQIERMPEHVVASVLIYVSMSDSSAESAAKEEEELPPFTYIHRAEIQHQHVTEVVNARHTHRRTHSTPSWAAPPATSALSKGILSCIMRVGDTTGALVSALYRQQYDSYLQAFNTRTRRAMMQTHAQRLAHTLLQIQQEITSVVQEEQLGSAGMASTPAAKARHSTPKKNLSNRFDSAMGTYNTFGGEDAGFVPSTPLLTDADQQKEVAEQAVEALNVLLAQFYALKQQYGQEQQVSVELRSKYKASLEECRIKASQFRAFYNAIKASNAILPLPVRGDDEDDANSLHSGLDKVAAHNATVPDTVSLQTAVASAVCNTQTLRKALEILAELAAHEEFAGYFNSLLLSLSQCGLEDSGASEIQSIGDEREEEEGFDRLLQVAELTPFARAKLYDTTGSGEDAPDMFATVWWVLEPGSHINAINLANAVQNVSNSLDVNTLHSKEKFLEALNTKSSVLVEGEELLQMLPHLLAFFSSRGHSDGHGNFPTVRLLYQPILVNLPKEEEEDIPDDVSYSSRESESITTPAETVVVAVVQYLLSGGSVGTSLKVHPVGMTGFGHAPGLPDNSSLEEGSADLSRAGEHSTLAGVLRQVGRDRIEQAIAYMGQHIANLSKVTSLPSGSASMNQHHHSRASKYAQHAMHVAMHQHVPRLLLDNNAIGGIHWNALLSALKFIVDPSLLPPASSANSDTSSVSGSQSSRSGSAGSVRSARSKRSSSGSVRSHSVSSSRSLRTSQTKSQNAEKIAAAAVYNPLSVWVGKLLVTLMRAEAASLLHVTGSVKTQLKVRPNVHSSPGGTAGSVNPHGIGASEPNNPAAERYSNVVYEGVLYKYHHGVVSGGAANDERSSLNILHVRPSSWTPLQQLIERYQAFFQSSTGSDVYVSYQESVLNYTRKASGAPVYSSRSVATSAASTFTDVAGEGKMCYILAGAINTSSVHPSATASAVAGSRKGAHVHFHDTEEYAAERVALKENDDFLVVELTRRPSNADIKAFSSVLQLVQAFVWGQQQRNQIKQRDAELGSIANALATSSQKLVEEQQENLQHRQFADLIQELQRQQSRTGAERSQQSTAAASAEDSVHANDSDSTVPLIGDIVRGIQQTQDSLCEVLGSADAAELVSAPRMVCAEVRDLLRSDTVSVASRGSVGLEEELHSARIDTVTRNFSKRALGKIMSVEYAPMGPNGQLDYAQYQNAAEVQYNLARLKFAALAVQLNVVLVCDVADAIVEEAMSLNLSVNKASVPAIARSIMVPIVDHASEFAVSTEHKAFSAHESGLDVSQYDEDLLPTSRLSWVDSALQTSVSNILDAVQGAGNSPERAMSGGFYQQFHYDLRQRQKQSSYATSTTVPNSAHAWALQLVFPTLEARDQYVTKLLGGGGSSTTSGVDSTLSTPSSSPSSSPVRGEAASSKGSVLPMTFLSGVTQFLKNSFVQCRSAVKDDIRVIQTDFEHSVSDRVTECMDQVLLMSLPTETVVSNEENSELYKSENELPMEFNVDEIAASVTHVFQHFKGKLLSGSDKNQQDQNAHEEGSASDSDDSVAEPAHNRTTATTFDCTLTGAHLHWRNLPAPVVDKKAPSVRFAEALHDHSDGYADTGATADFKVGAWLTVALNPPAEKKKPEAHKGDNDGETKASVNTKAAASSQSALKSKPISKSGLKPEIPQVDEEEEPPKGYKKLRDEALYKCCKLKQWQTQRSTLSAAQVQAVQDSAQGLMLYVVAAPKPAPRKETRGRSQSPNAHFSMHGGAAGYSSTSRARPGSVFSSTNHLAGSAFSSENDASVGVGEYLNADGCVHLQLLLLITGSEQPAILELRMKSFVTSGDSCPAALTKYTGRRVKRSAETVIDELALAEMMEQVACVVLQPSLPVLRLVRSSVAHLLEHSVAARGLVQWEAEWEHFLQHAQQRNSLLSSCLTLLTSEGHKAAGLLQQVQEALCRLPSLTASTLLCRDTTTNQVIYNRTLDYSNNHASDDLNPAATPQSSMGFMSPTPSASQGNKNAFNFPDSAFGHSTPRGEHKVSYMDLSRDPRHRLPAQDAHPTDLTVGVSLKDQFGHVEMVNPSLDQLEQLELVFECYEVQGSLTVYFAPGEAAKFAEDLRNSADFQSDGLFSPGAHSSTARSPSASRRAPASPYEPLRSPSAHRRAREAQRRLQIHTDQSMLSPAGQNRSTSGRNGMLLLEDLDEIPRSNKNKGEGYDASSGHPGLDSKRRDLVSLHTLLETITRAMARRVFELHRGSKNKKMMASKQHELSKRTSQLQQEAEKVSTLEAMNNMSRQELQTAAAESERLRLLMYAEQRNLKEALKQKKEMNAHLRQSLLEQRQESDTRALVHKKQQQELREKISALEQAKQKELKELDRVRSKGISSENAISTLTHQLAEVQRQLKTAEATVRQLRTDLALAQKELAAAQSRDKVRTEGDDSKTKGFLVKISRLDEELAAAKGTNAFLKKQLEATSLSLKLAQEENNRNTPHFATSTGRTATYTSSNTVSNTNHGQYASSVTSGANNLHSSSLSGAAVHVNTAHSTSNATGGGNTRARTPPPSARLQSSSYIDASARADAASPLYDDMTQSLQREQQNTARMRKQLQDMNLDRQEQGLL